MRPKIPDSLGDALDEEDEQGTPFYEQVGYTSKSGFIAQAVKEKIREEGGEI